VCQILSQVLPKGVLNVVTGYGPECGAPLVAHPGVGKVTFTGSVETGKIISRTAADKLIPVTLELGGKSPMIVMPDADLDKAAAGAVAGMRFTRQGQSCSASSRMLVHELVHDAFVAKVKALVDAMKIGDPMDESTDIGTIISPAQFDKVLGYIEAGRALPGTTAVECSALPDGPAFKAGLFVRPVMFTGLSNDSKLAREEIFGPVVCVIRFSDYEEAVAMANDTDYGLTASVWTRDLKTAMDASLRLQAGFVQVNQNIVAQPGLSYGGYKNSGLGKEASLEAMLDHFTQMKTILVNIA
jgi:aldehyde dehydrogenase (NAD+)